MLEKLSTALFAGAAQTPPPTAAERAAAIERLPADQRPAALDAEERIKAQLHDELVRRWRDAMAPAAEAWARGHYLPAVRAALEALGGLQRALLEQVGEPIRFGSQTVTAFVLCALFVDRVRSERPELSERLAALLSGGLVFSKLDPLTSELAHVFGYTHARGPDPRSFVVSLLEVERALLPDDVSGGPVTALRVERAQRLLDAMASSPTQGARELARLRDLFEAEDRQATLEQLARTPVPRPSAPRKLSLSVKF